MTEENNDLGAVIRRANKLFSKIPVKLGDEDRFLEYTMYSIMRLDEDQGIDLFKGETLQRIFPNLFEKIKANASQEEIGEEVMKAIKPRFLAQMIWAGLIGQDSTLTLDEVAKKLSPLTHVEMLNAFIKMQQAVDIAMPSEDQQKKKQDIKKPKVKVKKVK